MADAGIGGISRGEALGSQIATPSRPASAVTPFFQRDHTITVFVFFVKGFDLFFIPFVAEFMHVNSGVVLASSFSKELDPPERPRLDGREREELGFEPVSESELARLLEELVEEDADPFIQLSTNSSLVILPSLLASALGALFILAISSLSNAPLLFSSYRLINCSA
jgi:hypothetical protein